MKVRTGTVSEIKVSSWLLEQGYEVFRNFCHTGPVDLVALRGDEMHLIDVKTVSIAHYKGGSRSYIYTPRSPEQITLGVKLIYVRDDGIFWDHDVVDPENRHLSKLKSATNG